MVGQPVVAGGLAALVAELMAVILAAVLGLLDKVAPVDKVRPGDLLAAAVDIVRLGKLAALSRDEQVMVETDSTGKV
jgi:hypothetical protein